MLEVGQKVNAFCLPNQQGLTVCIDAYKGKKKVIYFYPKDDTPGCTRQACAFKDAYDEFKGLDMVVIGISKDPVESHQKFVEKYALPFVLLSDEDKTVIEQFGVWVEKKMYGKSSFGVARATFVLSEENEVMKVFEKANPDTNATDILAFINQS